VHREVRSVTTDSITPDASIDSLVRNATRAVQAIVDRPIARAAVTFDRVGAQYALGNLIADAQRDAAHADIGVMNNGGIRADLRAGPVTYGSLFEIQPFGNRLVRVRVRGTALREYLESIVARGDVRAHVSGVVVRFDKSREPGHRIVSAVVAGAPLSDDREYTVAYTDFMATGGDGLGLAKDALRQDMLDIVDLDALIAFVQAHPDRVVTPDAAPRLIPNSQ
jgi:2',3'-cyclic-nucleotide 2'-phosphodiesterase (5'-nucleotidase family)